MISAFKAAARLTEKFVLPHAVGPTICMIRIVMIE